MSLHGQAPYAGCLHQWDEEDACGETLDAKEIARRLDATEQLSAEDARDAIGWLEDEFYKGPIKQLEAYALAMEPE